MPHRPDRARGTNDAAEEGIVPNHIELSPADRALQFALDGLATRQRVTASNVANVDTPRFKASAVRFETSLRRAIERATAPIKVDAPPLAEDRVAIEVVPVAGTTLRNDGNNVDIDQEMVRLAQTQIGYSAVTQLVSGRLALLRSIITEGRR